MLILSLYVAIGGFFGSVSRFFISNHINSPVGTWIANVSGAIILGMLLQIRLPEFFYYSMTIGFCGAYTTFSTFGKEVIEYIINQKIKAAILYSFSSFFVSLLIVYTIYVI